MDRSEYMKKYREAHKDKCKEYRRKWRQAHKDDAARKAKNALYNKTYREKQKIMKTYYTNLKDNELSNALVSGFSIPNATLE